MAKSRRITLLTPFLARSRFHPSAASDAETANIMVRFIRERLTEALHAPRSSAEQLLVGQQAALALSNDLGHDLLSRYQQLATSGSFRFKIPRTPKHGDFTPQKALLDGDTLLVDWEFANAAGTVLFDAWFLRRSLTREARRRSRRPTQQHPRKRNASPAAHPASTPSKGS